MPVDLNADLGEGFGRWSLGPDHLLLDLITSANVACGFHAGDPSILRKVCESAASKAVKIGAQVSYRDLAGFGRRAMDVPADELEAEVIYQIGALDGMCRVAGTSVSYVKPHGALYNRCFTDVEQSTAVSAAVVAYDASLTMLGQPGSALLKAASAAGLTVAHEAFADRAYAADGSLVPRSLDGAVIHDPAVVTQRVVTMATEHTVEAIDGSVIDIHPDSICLHSDTPGAAELAAAVRVGLENAGAGPKPFT